MTGIRRTKWNRARWDISRSFFVCAVAALLAAGCHKASAPVEQKDAAPSADAAAVPAQPGAEASAPSSVPNANISAHAENNLRENVAGEVNQFMTQQLRIFIQQKGRMPVNFAEFAHTRLDGVPGAPNGMKWVIDSATQQVKAAAK